MSNPRPTSPREALDCRGPLDACLDAELFRALSDPTRLALLGCLAKCGRPFSVSEIAECCSVDLSVVSRHLAQLERAGALRSQKRGRTVLYEVELQELAAAFRAMADALDACAGQSDPACCFPPPERSLP